MRRSSVVVLQDRYDDLDLECDGGGVTVSVYKVTLTFFYFFLFKSLVNCVFCAVHRPDVSVCD